MTSDIGLQYIKNTEYSARCLFNGIAVETEKLKAVQSEIAALHASAEEFLQQSERYAKPKDYPDFDPFSRAFLAASKNRSQQALEKAVDLQRAEQEFRDKELSIAILSGGILQIAKQGITIVHERLRAAPQTRRVCNTWISQIIWQGRNQAMHFEERATMNSDACRVFRRLQSVHGDRFSLARNRGKNLAFGILEVLSWTSYDAYESDLRALL